MQLACSKIKYTQCIPQINGLPSKASKRDVFPDPVGPTIKLRHPRLKRRFSLIRRRKKKVEGVPGVSEPLDSFDHEKVA